MSKYMVLLHPNSESWPKDPKQSLATWEGAAAGADQLLKTGLAKEHGWFTNLEGYTVFEAESKEKVLEMVTPFFPLFSYTIHEVVPWEKGRNAVLAGARQAAGVK